MGSRWNWARGNIMWGSIFVLFGIPPYAFWVWWVSCLRVNFLFFKVPCVAILWNFTERRVYFFLVVCIHLLRNFTDHNSSEFGLNYLLPPSCWAWVFLLCSCEAYLVVLYIPNSNSRLTELILLIMHLCRHCEFRAFWELCIRVCNIPANDHLWLPDCQPMQTSCSAGELKFHHKGMCTIVKEGRGRVWLGLHFEPICWQCHHALQAPGV